MCSLNGSAIGLQEVVGHAHQRDMQLVPELAAGGMLRLHGWIGGSEREGESVRAERADPSVTDPYKITIHIIP